MLTGTNLIELGSIPSTNDYAILLCDRNKVDEGTFIWTQHQTKGRGQRGNSWESKQNEGLSFSIVYYPNSLALDKLNFLSIAAAVASRAFLAGLLPESEVQIKWPNDLVVNQKKIGGILVENSLQGNRIQRSIFGVGININQARFPEGLAEAISLFQLKQKKTDIKALVSNSLFEIFEEKYICVRDGRFASLLDEYRKHLWGKGKSINLIHGSEAISAILLDIEEDGSLKINIQEKIQRVFWPEYRVVLNP